MQWVGLGSYYLDAENRFTYPGHDIANLRVHATTRQRPRDRFDAEERLLLQPLAPRPYTSVLVPDAPRRITPSAAPRALVTVEKRPLAVYGRLTGGLA